MADGPKSNIIAGEGEDSHSARVCDECHVMIPERSLHSLSKLIGEEEIWNQTQVLKFQNLGYSVVKGRGEKKEKVKILENVNGEARSKELMGVLGPSGAGKSTFLDAVAGHIRQDALEGSILLNGNPTGNRLRRMSAYVQQDDQLFPMLTVRETFLFAAAVRLPSSVSAAERRTRVGELLQQLGLEKASETVVGDAGIRGISGGERRRVSIGIDILHDPAILFLDEPTSGLDASSAFNVMEYLQKIARAGSLVLCTIHQPSFRILDLMDKLLVFYQGQVAYLGPPASLPERLHEAGVSVPLHANSAEVIMDILYENRKNSKNEEISITEGKFETGKSTENGKSASQAAVQKLIELHKEKWVFSETPEVISSFDPKNELKMLNENESLDGEEPKFAAGFFMELWWLMWRAGINIRRTPSLFIVRIINVIVTSILLSSLFWKPNKGVQGAQNLVSFVVFAICLVYFTSNDALAEFIQERYIFIRESSHYAYRTSSYVLAHMLIFVPFLALFAVIFTTMCWWSVGLFGGPGDFFFFVLVLFCAFFTANSFVSFLSALVPNAIIGNTVALAITAYYLLTGGFFIKRSAIPDYWIWIHYVSSLKWPYDALLLSQFDRDECFSFDEIPTDLRYQGNPTAVCKLTSKDVLNSLSVGQVNKWACCAALVGLGLTYRFFFYVRLYYYSKSQRK